MSDQLAKTIQAAALDEGYDGDDAGPVFSDRMLEHGLVLQLRDEAKARLTAEHTAAAAKLKAEHAAYERREFVRSLVQLTYAAQCADSDLKASEFWSDAEAIWNAKPDHL